MTVLKTSSGNPIKTYWQQIESGEVLVGQKIRAIYGELMKLMDDDSSEWEYSEAKAQHAIDFIERYCKHSKGRLGGQPFLLELWQKAMISATFGFIHKIDGTRKYRELVLIVARKSGKSMLGSAIALYMLMADGEAGPEIVSAATKKDQAKIIWSEAKRIVKKSPTLSKRARCLVAEIVTDFNEGSFKPLSSESNTLDGLNVHCSLIDELHAIEDKNLYDVIVDGMSAREQPLSVITTTAGTIREGIYDIKYDECERILKGFEDKSYTDERVLPIIYELDARSEWTDPEMWAKANPGLGSIKSLDQLKTKVDKAKSNPLLVKNLLCKDFNIRETTSEAWLTFEQLNNPATFNIDELKPRYGILGVDLSQSVDLTAACVLFQVPGDETIYFEHMYWLPEDLLDKRAEEDKIPYDIWADMGLLRTTPGNQVYYKYIMEWVEEIQTKHDCFIYKAGYDAWSATYFVEELKAKLGASVPEAVQQTMKILSSPMQKLGADLDIKKINYNNNPITKWCLSNTSVIQDKNGNMKPSKTSTTRRRIDGLAAMLDAYVVYQDNLENYKTVI